MERFTEAAKRGLQIEGFIDVVKAVNERTRQDDRALRDVLRDYALEHRIELVKDTTLMTELAELPSAQDFAADMFRQTIRQQILDRRTYEQQLQGKDQRIREKEGIIDKLKSEKAEVESAAATKADEAEKRREHVESVMNQLEGAIESLPSDCRNARCEQTFADLTLERKGHSHYGAGEGDWMVRCAKCRCKLVS